MAFSRQTKTFARAAGTTQYAAGDLVANSETAGSVIPMTFGLPAGDYLVRAAGLYHTDQDATASTFRIWLLSSLPVVTNGDNGALAGINAATVLGTIAITADANCGDTFGMAAAPAGLLVSGAFYALIEATGTYTPGDAETFGLTLVMEKV